MGLINARICSPSQVFWGAVLLLSCAVEPLVLTLFPKNSSQIGESLEDILREIQLIADPWEAAGFLVGAQFMRHISFVGCMPFLRVEPEDGEKICYIELPDITAEPKLYLSSSVRSPRCPDCNQVVSEGDAELECQVCGIRWPRHQLLWGARLSCWTRQRINLHQIEKGDAAPSGEFLELLASKTGFAWDYCYL